MRVCEPEERGECCRLTCGAPGGAFVLSVWGQGHGGCWDGCGQSLQGSWVRWSWENCSERSCHLKNVGTKDEQGI